MNKLFFKGDIYKSNIMQELVGQDPFLIELSFVL